MYLYVPSIGLWTSHLFSVAWTSTEESSLEGRSNDSFKMLLDKKPQTTVSFLINGQDGFTRDLQRKAANSETRQFEVTVFAEGPYGMSTSGAPCYSYLKNRRTREFYTYGMVLLIASGVGVTNAMSYLHQFPECFSARQFCAVRRFNLSGLLAVALNARASGLS
ncbi:hypothetical protein BDW66DRAFT_2930 [Aspergillus desertorum]